MPNGSDDAPANGSDLTATASSGIKLLSEAVIPGGSLLIEKNIGGGLAISAVGLLGGAAMGAAFGPLGYLLTRVGASAISYNSAVKGTALPGATTQALQQNMRKLSEKLDNIQSVRVGGLQQKGDEAGQASTGISDQVAEGIRQAFMPPPPPPVSGPRRTTVAEALADAVSRGVDDGISRAVPRAIAEVEPRLAVSTEAGARQAERLARVFEDLTSVLQGFRQEEGVRQPQAKK